MPRFQFLGRLVAPFGELAAQALRRVPRTERAKEEVRDPGPCFRVRHWINAGHAPTG